MNLRLGGQYSRQDVHSIFSPDTIFTPQAGTWGLHGIIAIPDRDNDFVFFVTLGQQQGDHVFDEGISAEGVLSWQSQPRQGLDNDQIIKFINHDDSQSNIYLFLRTDRRGLYTCLGRLGYLTHDSSREKPVYFQWQLLDWDELERRQFDLLDIPSSSVLEPTNSEQNALRLNDKPIVKYRSPLPNAETFRARKVADYSLRDARNRDLGLKGEELVLEIEKDRLKELGLYELSQRVVHTSVVEGDGAGYDIRSFNEDGSSRFIEVKTTRGCATTDFYMSMNEIRFADNHPESYCLYRLYNFDNNNNCADYFIHNGPLTGSDFNLKPTNFRVSLGKD